MIFCKVLFAFLAISAILAAPIPDENQSFTLEKRGRKGGVGSNPPINLGVWLPQFPVHAALPPPPPPPPAPAPPPAPLPVVPAPLPGPARPIPTRRHTA
ncbi:hypothetical protein M408DRAFT_30811 [Serendipita vermifera MAFF 305830]|uniref:Uncharacterized protein n=1 Tax=Serendipita vermifera MAFF 305830 TaxID=933852 RepID=A0A0C3AIK8_SERVB|nr:hypothetical protein M408DRAFT_30811 [Serendipita vermifera MAFF 305830]